MTESDQLFEQFWCAGMRKMNKKKCRGLFNGLLKRLKDPEFAAKYKDPPYLTMILINDIQTRLEINQFGFNRLHPATYLNNERWEDDLYQDEPLESTQDAMKTLTDTTWADHIVSQRIN